MMLLGPDQSPLVRRMQNGNYEPVVTEFVRSWLRPGDIVIDIGAHIGYYTIMAAELVTPSGFVVAYEPEPRNFNLLVANLSASKVSNVFVFNHAVMNRHAPVMLYRSKTNSGDHRVFDDGTPRRATCVSGVPLDASVGPLLQGRPVRLLKCDTQGAEMQVLQGARAVVQRAEAMVVEFWPYGLAQCGHMREELLALLDAAGFDVLHWEGGSWQRAAWDALLALYSPKRMAHTNLLCKRRAS